MNFLEVLLISFSMAMDAFAVCLGAGTTGQVNGPRPRFRLAFHFGLFQFIMPVIGWLAGTTIETYIRSFDHWIAFCLLGLVGARMLRSGLDKNGEHTSGDLSRGWTMILLSIAVSIDALAVGLSLGLIGVFVWYPAIVIGVVTGLISLIGLRIGNRLGKRFGKMNDGNDWRYAVDWNRRQDSGRPSCRITCQKGLACGRLTWAGLLFGIFRRWKVMGNCLPRHPQMSQIGDKIGKICVICGENRRFGQSSGNLPTLAMWLLLLW